MDGIFGWLGNGTDAAGILGKMARAARLSSDSKASEQAAPTYGIAAASRFGKAALHEADGVVAAVHGRPLFLDDELAAVARAQGPAAAVALTWQRRGPRMLERLSGTFALAVLQPSRQQGLLAIDRIGAERLCYGQRAGQWVFGSSAQSVAAHPAMARTIDPQAIYEYLYFHHVPAPRTVYHDIGKLLPGEYVHFDAGRVTREFYWRAEYEPATTRDFDGTRRAFRELLNASVGAVDTPATAAFLSGGTDSSTIVGALSAVRGAPVDTFSIGFDAEGFDEMEYARCAVARFNAQSHEYYLKPADIVSAIPLIASEYDEPFGNDSAVPTYFCARAARDAGFTQMLAGDGGDEIFGGNARYAKQRLFESYAHLPGLLRRGVIEPLAQLPYLSAHLPLRKLRRYIEQAGVPLPQRLEAYNFLRRSPLAEILEPDFLNAVDTTSPDAALSEVYARTASAHYLNRMMHVDLKFTLADNDLRKVGCMTEAAGIEVRYPLLDDRLVALAHRLPVDYKVRGTRLRWFFKEALRDLLPQKIIDKRKHGFGLPFGVWSTQYAPLGELVGDSLADLGRRGWVRPAWLAQMQRMQHEQHATYYGTMIWVTMMLEQWLQANENTPA